MPATTDDYIHRIGRTGRVNRSGDALTLITDADTEMVNALERILKKKIERRKLDNFNYSQPAPERAATHPNRRPLARLARTPGRQNAPLANRGRRISFAGSFS